MSQSSLLFVFSWFDEADISIKIPRILSEGFAPLDRHGVSPRDYMDNEAEVDLFA
jgi:hypothetical protein